MPFKSNGGEYNHLCRILGSVNSRSEHEFPTNSIPVITVTAAAGRPAPELRRVWCFSGVEYRIIFCACAVARR